MPTLRSSNLDAIFIYLIAKLETIHQNFRDSTIEKQEQALRFPWVELGSVK